MATNVAGQRYRTWYAKLLRLYPRPFRERFGEGMAQTFHDLCREHSRNKRGQFGLALWIFFEFLPAGRYLYVLGASPRAAARPRAGSPPALRAPVR